MKPSEYLYGNNYNKELVKSHVVLFESQIEWAMKTIDDLCKVPLTINYFCFDSMSFIDYPVRDLRRINKCIESIKWNREKIKESNE